MTHGRKMGPTLEAPGRQLQELRTQVEALKTGGPATNLDTRVIIH
jgi:hypothetical protein